MDQPDLQAVVIAQADILIQAKSKQFARNALQEQKHFLLDSNLVVLAWKVHIAKTAAAILAQKLTQDTMLIHKVL